MKDDKKNKKQEPFRWMYDGCMGEEFEDEGIRVSVLQWCVNRIKSLQLNGIMRKCVKDNKTKDE